MTIVTVNAKEEAIPRLSALINREGNHEFTRAVLLVIFRVNTEEYIEEQYVVKRLFSQNKFTDALKEIIYKIWNFLSYWSHLTEIFTQYVK